MSSKFDKLQDPLWGDDFEFDGEVDMRDGEPLPGDLSHYVVALYIKRYATDEDADAVYEANSVDDSEFFTFPGDNLYSVSIPAPELEDLEPDQPYWVKTKLLEYDTGDGGTLLTHARTHLDDRVIFRSSIAS